MEKQHTLESSRRLSIEYQGHGCSNAVMKEGASAATPHALRARLDLLSSISVADVQ